DCVILNKRVELFESPKDAEAAFHTKLGTAIDVLQRGEKLDSAGNVVGERVLATLHRGGQVLNTVIWTRGSELHAIDSSSSNHVLQLEKWLEAGPHPALGEDASISELKFEPTSASNGVTKNGTPFSERRFKSTDCVELVWTVEQFAS